MDRDFPLNRFDFSSFLEWIQGIEVIPDTITDRETGIEFYGGNTVSREDFICFLENFNEIDNLAQNDAKQDYEKHPQFGVESYQFEPSWVEVSGDKVRVEYIGSFVNTEFNLTFKNRNGVWVLDK
ncbi:hypothetical protein D3Z51_08765 [Clostridiaceae bacterium]|nr:hypothetical protein [Clostridiaceae bacterium]RKI14357.1 hypothetical protein D7V81_08250 [bacterium 1XD21-70]